MIEKWLCLSLAVSGSLVIAGTMSGRLFVSSDAKEFEQLGTVHTKYVHRVCANSRFLVSASHDHTVFVWNLDTRQVLKQFKFSATCEALFFF